MIQEPYHPSRCHACNESDKSNSINGIARYVRIRDVSKVPNKSYARFIKVGGAPGGGKTKGRNPERQQRATAVMKAPEMNVK